MTHLHFSTGLPCDCTFTAHLTRTAAVHTADKLNDFLMRRPDLQTPEGQRWLQVLQRYMGTVGDKLDPLTPWLTREWKKGRLAIDTHHPTLDRQQDPFLVWKDPETVTDLNPEGRRRFLSPEAISHWADYYNSNHPHRRDLGDIMQHQVGPFFQRIRDWDRIMKEEAEQKHLNGGGEVVHQYPDGWSVRQLHTPEELSAEGNVMGHCVGGYARDVQNGRSMIYSLRDEKGQPHSTIELHPNQYEWKDAFGRTHPILPVEHEVEGTPVGGLNSYPLPNKAQIVQIQGKGNHVPIPEYQARLKNWFQSFPEEERPNWDYGPRWQHEVNHVAELDPNHPDHHEYYEDPEEQNGYGPHGDYGLKAPLEPPVKYDWDSIVESILNPRGMRDWGETYDSDHIPLLYRKALERGELPQLAKAVEGFAQQHDPWQDFEPYYGYPGEDYKEDPDRWDEEAEHRGLENGQEAFEQALNAYEEEQSEYESNHVPTQIADQFYERLSPHWGPDPATGEMGYWPYHPSLMPGLFPPKAYYEMEHHHPESIPVVYPRGYDPTPLTRFDPDAPGYQQNLFDREGEPWQNYQPIFETLSPTPVDQVIDPKNRPNTPWPPYQPNVLTGINGWIDDEDQHISKVAHPIYKRWVYAPSNGQVQLADNTGHPLDVKYHTDLARELNEPNLVHGYAYRIGDGWRVTDWDSRPVEDPYVVAQVMGALRSQGPADSPWSPDYEEDWDRMHGGLPS